MGGIRIKSGVKVFKINNISCEKSERNSTKIITSGEHNRNLKENGIQWDRSLET